MSRKILGLNIRRDIVSAVILNSTLQGSRVESHLEIPFAPEKKFEEGLKDALALLQETLDISGAVCVLGLPPSMIIFRNLPAPDFKSQHKIRQILPFELEPTLPLAVDQIVIDFQLNTVLKPQEDSRGSLLIAGVEQSLMHTCIDILETMPVTCEMITPGSYALINFLAEFGSIQPNTAFLDFDGHYGCLALIVEGQLGLVRGFSLECADNLCREVKRTITGFVIKHNLNYQPDEILITGSGFDEGQTILGTSLEMPVKAIELGRIADIKFKNVHRWNALKMDNTLALALQCSENFKCLNFRQGAFAAANQWEEHKGSLFKTAALAIMMLALLGINVLIDAYSMEKQLSGFDHRIESIFKTTFPDKRSVNPLHQMRTAMKELSENAVIPGNTEQHILRINILEIISSQISENFDVVLTRTVIGTENVLIHGNTDTFNAVEDIRLKLESVKKFNRVTISSTNMDKKTNRIKFLLKVHL